MRTRMVSARVAAALAIGLVVLVVVLWAVGAFAGLGLAGPGGGSQDSVTVNQDTAARTYALRGGEYNLSWTQTGCAGLRTSFQQVGGSYRKTHSYVGVAGVPQGSEVLSDVPMGDYEIEQTDPECATWEIKVERTGD